jgi:hypothetical protein
MIKKENLKCCGNCWNYQRKYNSQTIYICFLTKKFASGNDCCDNWDFDIATMAQRKIKEAE